MIDFEKWVIIDKLKKCNKCWDFYGCKKRFTSTRQLCYKRYREYGPLNYLKKNRW